MAAYRCQFDHILVVDFATTLQENTYDFPPEIIQFSVSVLDVKNKRIREDIFFNEYCKPVISPQLTAYCIATTGVQQENVDSALSFRDVYKKFVAWVREQDFEEEKFIFACHNEETIWKNAQYQFVLNKTRLPGIFRQWFDVSHPYMHFKKLPMDLAPRNYLPEMALHYKTDLEGKVFDSRSNSISLVRIVKKVLDNGHRVDVNCRLACFDQKRTGPMYVDKSIVWQRDPEVFHRMTQRILPLVCFKFWVPFRIEHYGTCPRCHHGPQGCPGLVNDQYPSALFRSLQLTSRQVSAFAQYLEQ